MDNIERLLIDIKESLERDIHGLHKRFDEIGARFDAQAVRLDRHAALLQTGSRWTNRMNEWAEKVDSAFEARDRLIADLSERIRRLEADRAGQEGFHRQPSRPQRDLRAIQPDGVNAQSHLTGTRFLNRNVFDAKHVGSAEFMDPNRAGHLPNLHITCLWRDDLRSWRRSVACFFR